METTTTDYPPAPPEECRYCAADVELIGDETVYGQSYGGKIYRCTNDRCRARVGVHNGTDKPLGTLADGELRDLRKTVHEVFDPRWKETAQSRQQAYDFIFGQMLGLPPERRHVAMLTKEECRKLIRILQD